MQRKAEFLNTMVIGLIVLDLITLLLMITSSPSPSWDSYGIVLASLVVNTAIYYLNRQQYVNLATHLFCYSINAAVYYFFVSNLLIGEYTGAILFGYMLSLIVLLGGLLISSRATFGFAVLNTSLIIITHSLIEGVPREVVSNSFPISAFFWLIALIAWLYQRALDRALDNLRRARQELIHTELVQRDLKIARDLQRRLYPPPPATGDHLAIASHCEPADETSGDFYDFIELGPDKLGIVVADVTGHSLPAAMIMTMTRSILRNEARRTASAAEVLRQTNQTMLSDASVDQMVTAFYGILNFNTLTLHFSNAGHPFPILKRRGKIEELIVPGLPLRSMPDVTYEEQAIQLEPGDQLVLISDGVIEAMNQQRELFGYERLYETILGAADNGPHMLLSEIWEAVISFQGSTQQKDDIALVVLEVSRETANGQLDMPVEVSRAARFA